MARSYIRWFLAFFVVGWMIGVYREKNCQRYYLRINLQVITKAAEPKSRILKRVGRVIDKISMRYNYTGGFVKIVVTIEEFIDYVKIGHIAGGLPIFQLESTDHCNDVYQGDYKYIRRFDNTRNDTEILNVVPLITCAALIISSPNIILAYHALSGTLDSDKIEKTIKEVFFTHPANLYAIYAHPSNDKDYENDFTKLITMGFKGDNIVEIYNMNRVSFRVNNRGEIG